MASVEGSGRQKEPIQNQKPQLTDVKGNLSRRSSQGQKLGVESNKSPIQGKVFSTKTSKPTLKLDDTRAILKSTSNKKLSPNSTRPQEQSVPSPDQTPRSSQRDLDQSNAEEVEVTEGGDSPIPEF